MHLNSSPSSNNAMLPGKDEGFEIVCTQYIVLCSSTIKKKSVPLKQSVYLGPM